jgi:hypothetical protein
MIVKFLHGLDYLQNKIECLDLSEFVIFTYLRALLHYLL